MGDRLRGRFQGPARRGRRPILWGLGALSGALLCAGAMSLAGAPSAGADNGPTQGSASAQSLQVTPHEGSLAVGAVFGEALAGNTGGFAKAQSEGLDLGAVGAAIKGYNCGKEPSQQQQDLVPSPLITATGDPGADKGVTQGPSQSNYGANEFVLANDAPYGEADTTYVGPVADPSNAIQISGMVSKAWSGVVNGVSEAGATSDIASVSLGGGAVVLQGLHWETTYPVNGNAQPTGSFTIGKVLLAGTALPNPADLSAVTTAVNQALGTLGLEIELPAVSQEQGIEFVDPLQIAVVPNSTRDGIVDPVVTQLQPTYYQLANGLENGFGSDQPPLNSLGQAEATSPGQQIAAALCQSDTPITVADITIASLDGGGFFNVALGGVNSSDAPLAANPFDLGQLGLGTLGGADNLLAGAAGTLGTPGSLGSGAAGKSGTGATTPLRQAERAGATGFAPGGPMLAAGLGGLGLLLGLAEGDRRLMRRAQRAAAASSSE